MSEKPKPVNLSYKMPPEWYSHAATQLHWPSNTKTWPNARLPRVEQVYLEIIEVLHQYEPIHLFVENEQICERAKKKISDNRKVDLSAITFHIRKINDVWARDCGPIFIHKKEGSDELFAITDWEYNAWGNKYPPYADDNKLPHYLAEKYNLERYEPGMVLEGGSIDTNGNGVLLTTESVLLNENRNPDMGKAEIEQRLREYLGIEKVIWLKKGLTGDDTDGHVDDIARFLNETTILMMVVGDPEDVNFAALKENLDILQQATDQHGNPFTIEILPLPETRIEGNTIDGSKHVPASYANFYIANGVVLVPVYDHRYDHRALGLFKRYFPDRDVVGIPCSNLVWGQGAIHCITQQLYGI